MTVHPDVLHFHLAFWEVLCMMNSDILRMERKELRHDRHTVSLLTGHMVFSSKYRGKILVEKMIVPALDGIIRKTCKGLALRSSIWL